jgi:hypothetical protein
MATTLATVLAATLAWPVRAGAEPRAEGAVRIEVDVSALPKGDRYTEDTRRWVSRNQTAVLERAGFVVSNDASRAVRIEISRYGEYGVHTRAKLMVVGDPGSVRELVCESCMDSQFLARVDEETAMLVERLRAGPEAVKPVPPVEAEPATEAEPEPEQRVESPEETDEPEQAEASAEPGDGRDGKRIGVAGYVGIGALALGAGVTLGGVIVLVDDPSIGLQAMNDDVEEVADRVPLGAGLTGIGAALLVAGAVLVTVDQTVLRKRRARRAQTALVPILSPIGAGLSWTARF